MSTRTLSQCHRCAENSRTCCRGFYIYGNTIGPVSVFGRIFGNDFLHLFADCRVTSRGNGLTKLTELTVEIEPTVGRAANPSDSWR